jgi:hypothetical protein
MEAKLTFGRVGIGGHAVLWGYVNIYMFICLDLGDMGGSESLFARI